MRKQFFGYKTGPVNKNISLMEQDFIAEKSEIQYELMTVGKENESLLVKIKEVTEKQEAIHGEEDFWFLAKDRVSNVIKHLSMQKKLEIQSLHNTFNELISPIDQQMMEIDREIQANEQTLDRIQIEIKNLIHKAKSNSLISMVEEDRHKDIKGPETAEGERKAIMDNLSPENQEATEKIELNDFWGGLEEWSYDLTVSSQTNNEKFPTELDLSNSRENSIVSLPIKTEIQEENHNNILVDQIDSIKSTYIVGKLAGEDLYDDNGNLIILKFDRITKEVVNQANRAGKLADLIVNMRLSSPGVG